ncbi:MAG: maleylpyruvate isomerase family mycothiol-dependent enzyme [Actinobacteria bacterium]|nr:maleylpyruvate isomerase family mycothiol-dependent enzyme [Actinomycetota bacterium]
MEPKAHLSALDRDGAAFAEACEAAGLAVAVTSCPGWSTADLLWHLTEVHHFWCTIVGERRSTWEGYERPSRPRDLDLLAIYRAGLAELRSVLAAVDPAQSNWTWSADQSAGFVVRRMAQETAVHRWDAEWAAKRDVPIESTLASDGIDEFLTHMIGDVADGAQPTGGSVHIHCTDTAGEWTLRPTESTGLAVAREHSKGDVAMRGAASEILLVLWRRRELARLDVVGDHDVAQRLIARTSLN